MMSSDNGPDTADYEPGYFNASLTGPFVFSMDMPPSRSFITGGHPFMSVLSGPVANISAQLIGGRLVVSVQPPAPVGQFLWTIAAGYTGYSKPTEQSDPAGPQVGYSPYTISLDVITILDDHDNSPIPDCGLHDCGEWFAAANLNGNAMEFFHNTSVCDCDAAGGPTYPIGLRTTVLADPSTRINVHISGYESDDDVIGNIGGLGTSILESRSDIWDWGSVKDLAGAGGQQLPADGPNDNPPHDYHIAYHVDQGGSMPSVISDVATWQANLSEELNEDIAHATDLGIINVSDPGHAPNIKLHSALIAEAPLQSGNTTLLGPDVDAYKLTFNDFANVSFPGLPASLSADWHDETTAIDGCPSNLGSRGGYVVVHSDTGNRGLVPYTLSINSAGAVLPADWGVQFDTPAQGRPVDLVTPETGTQITPPSRGFGEIRYLEKACAWQSVSNGLEYYRVKWPQVAVRPSHSVTVNGLTATIPDKGCPYDLPPSLTISARGMSLTGLGSNVTGDDTIVFSPLDVAYANREAVIQVGSKPGIKRSVYKLSATWNQGFYYTPDQCAEEASIRKVVAWVTNNPVHLPYAIQKVYNLAHPGDPIEYGANTVIESGTPLERDSSAVELSFAAPVAGRFDTTVVSSLGNVSAQLYDAEGVLIAEGTPIPGNVAGLAATSGVAVPQLRVLTTIEKGQHYILVVRNENGTFGNDRVQLLPTALLFNGRLQ